MAPMNVDTGTIATERLAKAFKYLHGKRWGGSMAEGTVTPSTYCRWKSNKKKPVQIQIANGSRRGAGLKGTCMHNRYK